MTHPMRYRWVALALAALVNVPVQVLWISYSAITPEAARYYGVGDFAVVLLSLLFMAVYVVASLPASWVIDTHGVRKAVGLGALLVGAGGVVRGLGGDSYPVALVATLIIALGQPLLLNAWTALPTDWFPENERAGAVGLTTVASLLGAGIGMVVPPILHDRGMTPGTMQLLFGAVSLAVAVLFCAAYRDAGAAQAPREDGEDLVAAVRRAVANRAFLLYLGCCTLGMGVFNGLTSLTAEIVGPRGMGPTEAGYVGAALLTGGVTGAGVLPALSDRVGRRVPFLAVGLGLGGAVVVAVGLATSARALYLLSALLGFVLVPLMPIGMAYAADLLHPIPDGTSNGIIQIACQASVLYIGVLWALRAGDGTFWPGLALSGVLMVGSALAAARLPETRPAPAETR